MRVKLDELEREAQPEVGIHGGRLRGGRAACAVEVRAEGTALVLAVAVCTKGCEGELDGVLRLIWAVSWRLLWPGLVAWRAGRGGNRGLGIGKPCRQAVICGIRLCMVMITCVHAHVTPCSCTCEWTHSTACAGRAIGMR